MATSVYPRTQRPTLADIDRMLSSLTETLRRIERTARRDREGQLAGIWYEIDTWLDIRNAR